MHDAVAPIPALQQSGIRAGSVCCGRQFRLRTLLLVVARVSIVLGFARVSPMAGVVVAAFSIPAMVRTARLASAREVRGQSMSSGTATGTFLASFALVVAITTTSLLLLSAVLLATLFWGASTFVATCRKVGRCTAPIQLCVRKYSWPVVVGTLGLLSATIVGVRGLRGGIGIASWPAVVLILLATLLAAGVSFILGGALLVCRGATLAGNHLTGACSSLNWLFTQARTGAGYLAGVETRLMREIRATTYHAAS
jgi:hypothetical protein